MERLVFSSKIFRFGLFEADVGQNVLSRGGMRVKIQDQPFRVLIQLLERPGEIVSRDELRDSLWPQGTHVDFDGSLNVILKKLRAAVDDDPDNPRFIETVPKRGYRFIAPVEVETVKPAAPTGKPGEASRFPSLNLPAGFRARPATLAILAAAAAVLMLAGVAYFMRAHLFSSPGSPKRAVLAILPFQNLSNDPAQEYFSDGLTEETITDLGQLSPDQLGVIARTSAMAYKHTGKTVSQIGHELAVDYILEGSVRREAKKVRITAQLIRVSDQTHLWARSYDRDLKDLIEVQNDLGRAIAEQVQAKLTPLRQTELPQKQPLNPEAYDLYLKGRFYWNQRTPESITQSIEFFQQAAAQDPDFALAYAGLADAYNLSNIIGPYTSKDSLPQAKAAAEKAITLEPSLAEAHAALGMEKSHYEFDFPGAEKEFLKAIELNPNSAYAHLFYSNCYLLPMGRLAEAIAENQKALALDPLSLPINNFLGMSYMFAGDYEKSYQQFQHTIALAPTFPLAHDYLAELLKAMGRYEEAIKEHEKAEVLGGTSLEAASAEAAAVLKAFKAGGERGFYQKLLELDLQAAKRGKYGGASGLAGDYALAGEKDKAFQWLDKAYEEREGATLTLLKTDPAFKSLHGDPRFSALLRRAGLPE
jgi:TolB-like protein/DNA-binding winged helix-turn-helix (wHTH) protein/Flp pilus assembly protein TadD